MEFEFEAEPVLALPPLVLPDTLALPLIAVCELVLLTVTLLLLVADTVLREVLLIWLSEPGPVLLILSLPPPMLIFCMCMPEFVRLTLASFMFWLLALPVLAEPP